MYGRGAIRTPKVNGQEAACVRVYSFMTGGSFHDVCVTHAQAKWCLYLDGIAMASESHSRWSIFSTKSLTLHFNVDVRGRNAVNGVLAMEWKTGGPTWSYELLVNNVDVPACWTKTEGPLSVQSPEVVGQSPAITLLEVPPQAANPPPAAVSIFDADQPDESIWMADADENSVLPMFPLSAPSIAPNGPPVVQYLDRAENISRVQVCGECSPYARCWSMSAPDDTRVVVAPPPNYFQSPSVSRQMYVPPPSDFDFHNLLVLPPTDNRGVSSPSPPPPDRF